MENGYLGLKELNGALAVLEGVKNASFGELVELQADAGVQGAERRRYGQIVALSEDKALIQVFEGTAELTLSDTRTRLTGHPMELRLSPKILGRTFNGLGKPVDGLGAVRAETVRAVDGVPINPCDREYPRDYIHTGISAIDGMMTLIRGQKLPIFSGNGLPHQKLAAQIARQASIRDGEFAVVFAAMGISYDAAEYYKKSFAESGALERVVMYRNLSNEPAAERLITPKLALTAAEYLAFEQGMHVLVILSDMTAFAEALREVSSQRGEIPSRKGFPGYLYSEFAAIYERAGIIKGRKGSVTQLPILTMPGDDITHPIPDLTGYITEGQIVLGRALHSSNLYPPVDVLPSLSRLMKDGIGKNYTREDHKEVADQLFSSYAKVGEVRKLASVIGEEELSDTDRKYLEFGRAFEQQFLRQGEYENRSLEETLETGWKVLSILPPEELDRIERSGRWTHILFPPKGT